MSEVKKNIGIVVALSIILAGGFFLFSEKTTNTDAKLEGDGTSLLVPAPDAKPGQEEMIVTEDALMQTVPAEAAVVTFTENGYSPASVTIKKGDVVRFENRANRDTWPASAFHPTHTIYPEKTTGDCLGSAFDACRGVPPGESWAFTFNHVGTWRYHDHLNAAKTGTIIVTE